MIYKIKKHINILIIIFFGLFSLINALIIIQQHTLAVGSDMQFHWEEILELIKSHRVLPYFALNSFSYSGSAVMTMYPYLFLYPFVWVFEAIKSVKLTMYIMFIVNTFISLIISYYSSLYTAHHDKKISFLFSIMYSISSVFIITMFITSDVGVLYTMIFLPLVIFGFINLLQSGKWLMLAIGMSLIVYSNVLASAFIPVLLVIWLAINFQYIRLSRLLNLIKAMTLSLVVTVIFWLPALKVMFWNHLHTPSIAFTRQGGIKTQSLHAIVYDAIHPSVGVKFVLYDHYIITIYALIGVIFGIIFYIKLGPILRRAFIFSLIVLYICSDHFPWTLLIYKCPELRTLQFTGRMFVVPQVLLTFILAFCISKFIDRWHYLRIPVILISILVIFSIQAVAQESAVDQPHAAVNNGIMNPNARSPKYLDYYPQAALPVSAQIINHQAVYLRHNKKYTIRTKPLGSGKFQIVNNSHHKIKNLSLPFLDYHYINYQVNIDHHKINNHSNRNQLLTISNVKPGQSIIYIVPKLTNL